MKKKSLGSGLEITFGDETLETTTLFWYASRKFQPKGISSLTCIVGIAKDGVVYMGADSCGSTHTSTMTVTNPKVFTLDTRFLIGVCASFRAIDLLQHSFKVNKQQSSMTDDCYMRTVFISSVRECFLKNDFPREDSDDEVNFLVGYNGKIYCVEDDYGVLNPPDWGHSIGSGADPARGSLWTTMDSDDPEFRVQIALEASAAIIPSVSGPFLIEKLPKNRKKSKSGEEEAVENKELLNNQFLINGAETAVREKLLT